MAQVKRIKEMIGGRTERAEEVEGFMQMPHFTPNEKVELSRVIGLSLDEQKFFNDDEEDELKGVGDN